MSFIWNKKTMVDHQLFTNEVDGHHYNSRKTNESNKSNLKDILLKNYFLFENDKIFIPANIKHIKFDIGLSYSAPQSQIWLSNEDNLLVFGFEPNVNSVKSLYDPNNKKRDSCHGDVISTKFINDKFFIAPIALSNVSNDSIDFYITEVDEGCSSIFEPNVNFYKVQDIIKVPVFTLSDFFELLPLDKINFIEYIKIDAQGSDLNIIKGGEKYISEKVVFVTLEPENNQYKRSEYNSYKNIKNYMNSIGFNEINHPNTTDPTFLNSKFIEESKNIYINQI